MKRLRTFGMMAALILGLGTVGQAHDYGTDSGRYDREGWQDARRQGYEQGYRDGAQHGQADRQRGVGYDIRNNDFKKGDRGYNKAVGNKGEYKKGYREGYQAGYDRAYYARGQGRYGDIYGRGDDRYGDVYGRRDGRDDRYGRWDPSDRGVYSDRRGGYSGVAYQNGYRKGLEDGRNDVRKNKAYDPQGHDDYSDADNGYHSEYGSKQAYKQEFRNGYRRGYQEGFGAQQYGRRR
jgi:hypothetical protein